MRIGLVPISAKPYHTGHHALVEIASKDNDAVLLFVSTSDRLRDGEFPIYGDDMKKVWLEELEAIMPANVEIEYGGSPVRKVYETIQNANSPSNEDSFTVYSDPTDTYKNYPEEMRHRYMQPLYDMGQVIFAAEEKPEDFTRGVGTPNVSGGKLRHYLETKNLEKFAEYMPPGVDAEKVFGILRRNVSESLVKDFVFAILK
jgi:hypothetical protein